MGILVCRPGEGVRALASAEKQSVGIPCPFSWPCVPCASPGCIAFCCQQSRECLCVERQGWKPFSRMPCAPGVCEMCFSACGRYLYQLGSDADSIHTRCAATGELMYAAPAGVFPRCMRMDASGSQLLCACGAVGEAVLLNAPDLTLRRTIATRHPCFLADFWQGGLVLVCAAEGDDIQTILYTLAPKTVRPRRLLELPGPPGGLCVCPDGQNALLSTRSGLMKIDLHTGGILWNCPEWALCMRVECRGNDALISDTLDGSVWILNHQRPWERRHITACAESQACFL